MVLRSLLSAVLVMDGVRSAMSLVNCTNDLYSAATSGCKDDCSGTPSFFRCSNPSGTPPFRTRARTRITHTRTHDVHCTPLLPQGNGLCWSSFDASTLTWSEEAICHCENWFTGASCSVRTVESMEVVPTLVDQFDGQHVDMTVLFEGVGTDGEDVEVTENGTVLTPEQTNAVEPTIRIPADAFDEARSRGYNLTLIVANPDAKYQVIELPPPPPPPLPLKPPHHCRNYLSSLTASVTHAPPSATRRFASKSNGSLRTLTPTGLAMRAP